MLFVSSGVNVRMGAMLSTVGVDNSISSVGLTRMVACCLNSIMQVISRLFVFICIYLIFCVIDLLKICEYLQHVFTSIEASIPNKTGI